ncbi:hypothetical protein DV738_g3577, partial [Chaetothyriales sp. CBS 135597]
MGASESKLVFKRDIFRLSEGQTIPANDPYWTGYWELPESVEDVFSLFSGADVRRTRDAAIDNLETLLLALTSRLVVLRNHPSFPDPELAPEREALNCIRVLTRILPYIYEADNLAAWEDNFFWAARRRKSRRAQLAGQVLFDDTQEASSEDDERQDSFEDAKPLGEELIDTLIDLLFFPGFTVPHVKQANHTVVYAIWQSGVGCKTSLGTSKELENNRCEVLRLLLTLTSKSMYLPPHELPVRGLNAITYLVTCPDKQIVLSVLCSLLNTTIKYNGTSWRLPYDHVVWKDSKQSLVVFSIQFLLVLILYPVPEAGYGPAPKNFYRHFMGRLHRPEDFQFLADGISRVLSQPMQATASYLPGSQKAVKWAPEMIILFWELLQCNKRFRSFIIQSNRAHDFVIFMLFYAIEARTDVTRQGLVRMCVFVLQTMSVESAFGINLNKKFDAQDTLPASIRIPNFRGTYTDFLISSIHTLITGSKGRLEAIYPALLAIINNVSAYAQNLSMPTCSKLMQLFTSMSTPSFLLANETNHTLLQALLESLNAILEHQYAANPNMVYSVIKSRKTIEALRIFTLEGGQQELENRARAHKDGASETTHPGRSSVLSSHESDVTRRSSEHSDIDQTFAIGDSDDSDNEDRPTPSQSSTSVRGNSRTASESSLTGDDHLPIQLRGMSQKARGKLPAGASTFSRHSSTTSLPYSNSYTSKRGFEPTPQWLDSWLPQLPLHTMLTIIKALSPKVPSSPTSARADSATSSRRASLANSSSSISPLRDFLHSLPQSGSHPLISPILASPSPIRIHLFEWSPLSLGWYMSVLWSLIYAAEMTIAPTSTAANTLTGTVGSAGPVGTWNGTHVKLFAVATDGAKQGPSLAQPRGAVDAVGTRLPFKRSKGPLPSQKDAFQHPEHAIIKTTSTAEKQKPNFATTGRLAAASNTVQKAGQSIVLKYHEPPEARKPSGAARWRMYVFKGEEIVDTVELAQQSCWLFGREAAVVDVLLEHPSTSKQHAVIQFRYTEVKNEFGDRKGRVKPYILDLESANGTTVNGDLIPNAQYIELRDKDVVQFGRSSREYIVQLAPAE